MQSRSYLIYEYFKPRITFGCYSICESLPSAGMACRQFACSPQTVRKALLRMRDEGYISLSPGRRAKVIYDADLKRNILLKDHLLARKEGLSDLKILIVPPRFQARFFTQRPLVFCGFRRTVPGRHAAEL